MRFILTIAIIMLAGCGYGGLHHEPYHAPGAAAFPTTYDAHDDSVPNPTTKAVIGDSYVYLGAWQTWLPGAENLGVGGDTVAMVLARVQAQPSLPPTVYLWCGINDLQTRTPRDVTMAEYGTLIDTVRAKGATTVICLSPMPLAPQYPWATGNNLGPADFGTLTAQLQDVANGRNAQWLNLWPAVVLPSGWCDPQYSQPAGIHLNEAGYDRVVTLILSTPN